MSLSSRSWVTTVFWCSSQACWIPARAKSLIGETAQLVWKHRRLEVPRPLDEISSEDIVSVEIGPIPIAELGPEETLELGLSPETEVAPEAEATGEGEEAPPEEVLESSESETETEEATESSAPEGQASSEEEAEEEPPPQPMLLVEFTPEGAQRFGKVVDGLRKALGSMLSSRPLRASTRYRRAGSCSPSRGQSRGTWSYSSASCRVYSPSRPALTRATCWDCR